MKNILIILTGLLSLSIQAQSLYTTAGAQCGAHGSGGCLHYQTPCPPETDAVIHFVLRTDDQGQETAWQLFDVTDNAVVEAGSNLFSNTTYDISICAYKDHCYRLTITDAGGNGLDPAKGAYTLAFNGETVAKGGVFTDADTVSLGGCCTDLRVSLQGGVACYDATSGQVMAVAGGGVAPYTYTWSTGATFTILQRVLPGDDPVSVSVTDAAGCVAADTLAPGALTQLALAAQTTTPSVKGAADGQIRAVPAGGIAPYTYLWSTGAGTAVAAGLATGNYTVTVQDAGGCSVVQTVMLPDGPSGAGEVYVALEGFRLFPNPATGNVTIEFSVPDAAQGQLQLFNPAGQVVLSRPFQAGSGENQITFQLNKIPQGIYTVYVQVGQAAGMRRLVLMQ